MAPNARSLSPAPCLLSGGSLAAAPRPGEGRATIVRLLPRRTALARKMAGRAMDAQVLAANLDTVFVVTSLNRAASRPCLAARADPRAEREAKQRAKALCKAQMRYRER